MPRAHTAFHLALAALCLTALVAACTSAPVDRVPGPLIPGPITGEIDPAPGVPEECVAPFPLAFGPADIGDVALLPPDWPEPPTPSTLCLTSRTADHSIETVDFATSLEPIEVLSHYASRFPPGAQWRRVEGVGGPVLAGTAGGVSFEVRPDEGRFSIVLVEGTS